MLWSTTRWLEMDRSLGLSRFRLEIERCFLMKRNETCRSVEMATTKKQMRAVNEVWFWGIELNHECSQRPRSLHKDTDGPSTSDIVDQSKVIPVPENQDPERDDNLRKLIAQTHRRSIVF